MKVINQKNVYYVDLNKSIYRGYIETTLIRESNEKVFIFKSVHLSIESALIIGYEKELKIEYFNSKAPKQKSTKNSKIAVVVKSAFSPAQSDEKSNSASQTLENCSNLNTSDENQVNDFGFTPKLNDQISSCYDSFRLRIPDNNFDLNLTIRIVYSPTSSNPAILWYKPVAPDDKHREVVACNFHDNSSCIAPYIDCITHFNLIYVIPNTEDSKVISSGSFKSIKEEDKNIVYLYSTCSHPKYFSFSVGSFVQNDIFSDSDRRKIFTPCCIETDFSEVSNDLQSIIKYIENFTKTRELSTCNIVFSMINVDNFVSKSMIVLRYSHFPCSRDIEMSYYLKRVLCDLLSSQVYHFMNWCSYDSWIDLGFTGYLSDYCIRHLLGNNEFLCNYYQDKKFVVSNDIVEFPLFYTLRKETDSQNEFFRKKSKLVFHCMESHLSYAFLQKISDEVIESRNVKFDNSLDESETFPVQSDCYSNLKRCFTSQFMKIVKDSTGKDLKTFFDFYLFRPGLMKVRMNFQINKKKNSVRATMSYMPTSTLPKSNKKIISLIDIKSIELEGNFDHTVVNDSETTFMYHTRTKKKKKEEEEEVMPLLYIRIDPKRLNLFEYIADQPDYMHIEQLQEKNVIGQLESIESLALKPTIASCEALERMLDNSHVFYKVRIRAAYVLRSTSIEGYDGLQRMVQYFIKSRCVANSTVLKGNEFGLIPYFIQKHLIKCISVVDLKSETLFKDAKVVLSFYENILKFNDNSLSKFDDSWYISSVINLFTLHTLIMTSVTINEFDSFSSPDYFSNGFSKLVDQSQNINIDDFFKSKSVSPMKQSSINSADNLAMIDKCMDVLERFRISDLVFPSNNNVITRICLLSYIRLAYYNKIKISKEALKGLSSYPNILSVRAVAIEGLLLLFSDSTKFVLESITNEVPVVIQTFLEILIKVFALDLRAHFQDTNEFDVKLSERMRIHFEINVDKLIEIYKINFINLKINEQIRKILCIIDNRTILISELQEHCIKRYDAIKEESNRIALLRPPSSSKRIRVANLNSIRESAFELNYTIRIPRIKNFKPKPVKEANIRHFKIRICPKKFLVKHSGNFRIKFKMAKSKIKVRKSDIPVLLINKFRENRHSMIVDEFILNNKSTGFFTWEAHTSKQILDLIRYQKLNSFQTFKEIERSMIFVLSYNTTVSKSYLAAKALYSSMETIFLHKNFIVETISPLSSDLRKLCQSFLTNLAENPKFEPFLLPVDTKELKNYLDIVRVPSSFHEVQNNILIYESFEAFIVHLERIYINCLNFNDSRSLIAEYAQELKIEIDIFKSSIPLEQVDSIGVIRNIIEANNIENLFDPILENILNIVSWGDIDEELLNLKKKYTRSSHCGKVVASCTKQIREEFKNWFLVDSSRVLVLPE